MAGIYTDDPIFISIVRNKTGITRLIAGITLQPYERAVTKFYDKDEIKLALQLVHNDVLDMNPQPTIDQNGNLVFGSGGGGDGGPISTDLLVDGDYSKVFTIEYRDMLLQLDQGFTYTQPVPSDTWIITHTFDKKPSVTVVDNTGTQVIGDVRYAAQDKIVILFSTPFSGSAYLN